MSDLMLIRLKPYDKAQGHLLRTYMYHSQKFEEARGWYPVRDAGLVDYLRKVHQIPGDDRSKLGFDICTPEEALKLDKTLEEAAVRRSAEDILRRHHIIASASSEAETTLTTADLPKPKPLKEPVPAPASEPAPVPPAESEPVPAPKAKPSRRRRRRSS